MTDRPSDIIYDFLKGKADRMFSVADLGRVLDLGTGKIKNGLECLRRRHMINCGLRNETPSVVCYWYEEEYEKANAWRFE